MEKSIYLLLRQKVFYYEEMSNGYTRHSEYINLNKIKTVHHSTDDVEEDNDNVKVQ